MTPPTVTLLSFRSFFCGGKGNPTLEAVMPSRFQDGVLVHAGLPPYY